MRATPHFAAIIAGAGFEQHMKERAGDDRLKIRRDPHGAMRVEQETAHVVIPLRRAQRSRATGRRARRTTRPRERPFR